MPFHPVIVHIPLVLAGLTPFVAAYLAWQAWHGRGSRRAWAVALALQVAIVGAALIAIDTGGDEAGVVRDAVPRGTIGDHASAAKLFTGACAAVLVLLVAATALRDKRSAIAGGAAAALAIAAALLGVRAGHKGGSLVFEHDAPAAYRAKGP